MKSENINSVVTGIFEKGKKYDSFMLFIGVALIIIGFLTIYDTDIWKAQISLWKPISGLGVLIIFLNLFLRLFRQKMTVDILQNSGENIIITPVVNIQFSGWVKGNEIIVKKQEIISIKVYDFYNPSTGAGMFWVAFEEKSGAIIELKIDSLKTIKDIICFCKQSAPDITLIIDERIKI